MSASTAMRFPEAGNAASVRSAAIVESGFALYVSFRIVTPFDVHHFHPLAARRESFQRIHDAPYRDAQGESHRRSGKCVACRVFTRNAKRHILRHPQMSYWRDGTALRLPA